MTAVQIAATKILVINPISPASVYGNKAQIVRFLNKHKILCSKT